MRLARLELQDFRCFEHAGIDFSDNGLLLLVGPNNAGKTALLTALDRLVRLPEMVHEDIRTGTDKAMISATFAMSTEDRANALRAFHGEERLEDWLSTPTMARTKWTFSASSNQLRLATLEIEADDRTFAPVLAGVRRADLETVFSQPLRQGPIGLGGQTGQQPHEYLFGRGTDYGTAFREPFERWRSSLFHFGADRRGSVRERPLQASPTLEPSGENLPDALLWLHTNREATDFAAIRDIMSRLIPDVGTLATPGNGGSLSVAFEDRQGVMRNLKDLGSGVEQLLLLTFVGVSRPDASIVVFEEPERDLHPDAQRLLLSYLQDWSKTRPFVVATHSPIFLDRAETATGGTWLVTRQEGESTVERLADITPALDAIGVRLGDVLTAERVLLVEGPSDRDVIEHWFGQRLHEGRAVVVDAGGGDGAWDVERLLRWTNAASKIPQRFLFLRDRDELDDATVDKLKKRNVVVLAGRELENLLLDPDALAAVLAEDLQGAQRDPGIWDPPHIQEVLAKAADGLIPRVVLGRVFCRLGSIRALPRSDLEALRKAPSKSAVVKRVALNLEAAAKVEEWWDEEDRAVRAVWPDQRLRLAPGEELLDALWRATARGRRYQKGRDALRIAKAMKGAPAELVKVVDRLLV